ncbi:PilW family protein [Sporomusa sp.]|uniref:PilW family protein n=1 Tax=Sporomusa sp. TaxID=2078658 RepID=UPI002CE858D4|nr:prepilin-type N-terminal cleavage/methylation domain-containing protein [Sporomusa sp.]HWR43648.1 prepilin-type N-terminal cleavage/methylation domain-containing protein [Sporomusa sp.]
MNMVIKQDLIKNIKGQSGFTLIELMIGLGLTVLLMSAIFGLLFTSLRSWQQGKSHVEIHQTVRIAVDTIARQVRYAYTVSSPDGKTLRIKSAAGIIVFGVDPETKALCITQGSGSPQPFAGNGVNDQEGSIIIIDNPDGTPMFTAQGRLATIKITAKDKTTGATFTCQSAMAVLNHE